jgi:Ulp1 family protease
MHTPSNAQLEVRSLDSIDLSSESDEAEAPGIGKVPAAVIVPKKPKKRTRAKKSKKSLPEPAEPYRPYRRELNKTLGSIQTSRRKRVNARNKKQSDYLAS